MPGAEVFDLQSTLRSGALQICLQRIRGGSFHLRQRGVADIVATAWPPIVIALSLFHFLPAIYEGRTVVRR